MALKDHLLFDNSKVFSGSRGRPQNLFSRTWYLKVKSNKLWVCFPCTEFSFDFWVPNCRLHATFKSVFRNKQSKLDNEHCSGAKYYLTVQSAKASRYETSLSSPHGSSLLNSYYWYYYGEMTLVAPEWGRSTCIQNIVEPSMRWVIKQYTLACWAAMWNYFANRFTRQSTFLVFLFNWIV